MWTQTHRENRCENEETDRGDSSTSKGALKVTRKLPGKTDSSSQPSEGTDYAGTLRSDFSLLERRL